MPDISFSEIARLGTDEGWEIEKLNGIVTDEGKRTFSHYHKCYHQNHTAWQDVTENKT